LREKEQRSHGENGCHQYNNADRTSHFQLLHSAGTRYP
jgi:hypothetical protein